MAHPGHELLLRGWIAAAKPVVHVVTDGSRQARLEATAAMLRDAGARPGTIFGRLSDQEAYAMILERNTALLFSIVAELAAAIEAERPAMIVSDAAEGYNPVHDLCRLIAGAAIALAGAGTQHYEYAVVESPDSPDADIVFELDDDAYAAKLESARRHAAMLPDVDDMLSQHGAEAYRVERFRRVADWSAISDAPPLYERFGEARVAAQRYTRVIRRAEHIVPLRDAVCAAVEKRACAF